MSTDDAAGAVPREFSAGGVVVGIPRPPVQSLGCLEGSGVKANVGFEQTTRLCPKALRVYAFDTQT